MVVIRLLDLHCNERARSKAILKKQAVIYATKEHEWRALACSGPATAAELQTETTAVKFKKKPFDGSDSHNTISQLKSGLNRLEHLAVVPLKP